MDTLSPASPLASAASAARVMNEAIGRVAAVTGSTATVELTARHATSADSPTVGKFMGITTPKALIIGLVTEVSEQALGQVASRADFRKVARLDLIGEIVAGKFSRGVTDYPTIGDATAMLGERELRVVYGAPSSDRAQIGTLQQNPNIAVHIDIDHMVSRH
ncbi:MAG TPA: hypothetical protein VHL13_05150, partial [Pseudolabrys sp.]|nr:hypothetical protein [Pseudolabrys sp.]